MNDCIHVLILILNIKPFSASNGGEQLDCSKP